MVTACNYPAREGIKVETHSEKVLQARRILVGLLLARCPQVPFIQEFARELGVEKSPFKTENPENDCILCGLCVRTCNEIVGANAIGFSKRGTQKKIGTPFEIDSDQMRGLWGLRIYLPHRGRQNGDGSDQEDQAIRHRDASSLSVYASWTG